MSRRDSRGLHPAAGMICFSRRGFSRKTGLVELGSRLIASIMISVVMIRFHLIPRSIFPERLSAFEVGCFLTGVCLIFLMAGQKLTRCLFVWLGQWGQRAFEKGNYQQAARFLYLFSLDRNNDYDETGEAHRTLLAALLHLGRDREATRVAARCERLGFETDLEAKD